MSDTDPDPFSLFRRWFAEAEQSEPNDPNAMALATISAEGQPNVRMVLLKGHDERGFVFYTNLESAKGTELASVPKAALCFHWKSLQRQVRVRGSVQPVDAEEADAYFASRPRDSRIGAWASQQSRPLAGRWELEKRVAEVTLKFNVGAVPRPPFWSGFRVVPDELEFWRDRPFRLHERLLYRRSARGNEAAAAWEVVRLYP